MNHTSFELVYSPEDQQSFDITIRSTKINKSSNEILLKKFVK